MKKVKIKNDEHNRFKVFRKAENLTQKQMAEILGKEQPTVQRYESGETFVPHDVIRSLYRKLDMSLDWFFNGTEPMKVNREKPLVNFVSTIEGTIKERLGILRQQNLLFSAIVDKMETGEISEEEKEQLKELYSLLDKSTTLLDRLIVREKE